jgi:hypothetical protein
MRARVFFPSPLIKPLRCKYIPAEASVNAVPTERRDAQKVGRIMLLELTVLMSPF